MSAKECKNCGAPIAITDSVCSYCHSPNREETELTAKQREGLTSVAKAMETVLEENSEHRWSGPVFLLLFGAGIGSYFLFKLLVDTKLEAGIFTGLTTLVLFVFFGFSVGVLENRQVSKVYKNEVKKRIDDYLTHQGIHRYSFDEIAQAKLEEDAKLQRFLFKA